MKIAYNPTFRGSPAWTFGGRTSTATQRNAPPGPGNYEHAHTLSSIGSKFSMAPRGRRFSSSVEDGPGPGAYGNEGTLSQQPSYSMYPTSKQIRKAKTDRPGPGSYSPEHTAARPKGPLYSFGFRTAMDNKTKQTNPGPGAYTPTTRPTSSPEQPKVKFGSSTRPERKIDDNPGPGNYETRKAPADGPQFSFGGEQKKFAATRENPYPGPGTYKYKESTLTAISTSMKPRRSVTIPKHIAQGPGPGSYSGTSSIVAKWSPAYRVGTAHRSDFTKVSGVEWAPGPGGYNPQQRSESLGATRKGFSFGTGVRPNTRSVETGPGPGAYLSQKGLKPGTPSFSMRPRTKVVPASGCTTPGPGRYNHTDCQQVTQASPNYRIGTSTRPERKIEDYPGPGTYDDTKQMSKTAPQWGFGSEQKAKELKPESAVGYDYELPSSFPSATKL